MEIQYRNVIYQIPQGKRSLDLRREMVLVLEDLDEKVIGIEYKGMALSFREYSRQEGHGETVDTKEIERFLTRPRIARTPSYHHPWVQQGRAESRRRAYMAL